MQQLTFCGFVDGILCWSSKLFIICCNFETIGSKDAADRPYKLLRCDLLGGQPLSEAS